MDKKTSKNETNNAQASDQGLPAWVLMVGAALLVALFYTSYQMVQRGNEVASTQKALNVASGTQAETAKEIAALKKAAAENVKEIAVLKKAATKNKKEASALTMKISDLNNDLANSKASLGSLQDKLKAAMIDLAGAKAESAKNKIASQAQDKLAQQVQAAMKETETLKTAATGFMDKITSLEKDLTASKSQLGDAQGELKAANSKLSQAMAMSEKHKQAAEEQAKLAQEFKEKAERAAAQ